MKRQSAGRVPGSQGGLEVQHVPTGSLEPAGYNPRRMPAEAMAKLKRSIERFGMVEPIVVRRKGNIVVGGHQRLKVARQLGLQSVPVIFVDISEQEAKLLNLALNKIAGEWDTVRLASLLSELRTLPTAELELSGFLRTEASAIIRSLDWSRRPSPDYIPEPPEVPTAKRGDLWRLGDHLVLCGDCTDAQEVERLLGGASVDMLFTDAPYGIGYDPSSRPGARARRPKLAGDCLSDEDHRLLIQRSLQIAFDNASPGAAAYAFHASTRAEPAIAAFRSAGWRLSACIIWVKPTPTPSRGDYSWQHEPILYGRKPGGRHRWFGGRSQSTVWHMGRDSDLPESPDRGGPHPTRKPVALVERAITNSSRPSDIIYDPFVGSGTTIIACERLARRCLAVEIEPRFVDMTVARWETYAGRRAELAEEA